MIQHQDCVVRYRYEDFILKLRRTEIAHEYVVGAQASNRGPIERPVVLPQWSEDTSIIYSSQEQDRVKIKQFGSELFDTLFQGAILALYHQCLEDIVQARDTSLSHLRGLRIILDLQDAPYLIHIPWEFLYDAEANQFLCLDPRTPVVRLLCQGARFSQVEPSLRCFLLSAAAPPEAQQPLREAEEEIKEIQKILRDSRNIEVKGHFPSARADDLLDIMKEGYHIVHFTGHGLEDQLVFDDRRLSDEQIRSIFTTNPALRLVVINACLAGQKVTEALARSGIPAIIGFQFEITDKSGRVFAQEFYKNLAAGYPLEASLHRGRVALLTELPDFEWAGPVLYLQATSSEEVLGDTLPVDKEKGAKLDLTPPDAKERLFRFLLERGKKSSGQGHYQKAIALLEGADGLWEPEFGVAKLDIGKDIQRCQTELEEKRRKFQNKLSKKVLFEKAQNYASEQPRDWDNAFNLLQVIGQLEELEELSRSRGEREQDRSTLRLLDREMNELFQHVRDGRSITHECQKREIRLKALYDQGEEGRHKQDWDQAIIFFEEAAREVKTLKDRNVEVDERYQDAERLANEARNQKDLHELYQCGVSLLEQELWHGAVNVFEQLRERALSYPGLDAQLAKARRERDAKDTYDRGMHAIQNGDWEVAIRDLRTIQPGAHCYQKADLALQYAQGCFYMEQEQWAQAVKVLADVVGRPSNFEGDARRRYEEAQFRRDLGARYQAGRRRMEEDDWQEAKADLQWVKNQQQERENPVYSDVDQLLDQIEEERFLEKEYQQAQNFFNAKNWEQTISHLQVILNVRDDYRDAACEMLAQAQARKEAEVAYQRGIEANLKHDWPTAIQAFEEAIHFQPDHEEARNGLETARHNLALEDNYQQGMAAYRRGVAVDGVVDVTALKKAIHHLEQVDRLDPDFRDAADRLKESRRLLEAEQNYQAAVRAEQEEDWTQAVKSWQQVADLARDLNRDYQGVTSRLRLALRQKELAELYQQAQTHQTKENWAEAVTVLSDLVARTEEYGLVPYKDAQAQLKEAKRQARIAECFDNGLFCVKTERWEDAITLFNEIIHLDPEHEPAQEKLEEASRQFQLQSDYEAGVAALKEKKWPVAVERLSRVDRTYKDTVTRLKTALRQQKLANSYQQGLEHANKGEWGDAFACFDEVKREDPNYLDIQPQWRQAYQYKEIDQLYQRARKLEEEGKLEEAIKYYDEVQRRRQNVQQS